MVRAVIFDFYGVLALNGWQGFKAKHFTAQPRLWNAVFELGRKVDAGLADYAELIGFTAKKTGQPEATVRYQLEHTVANEELLAYIAAELKPRYKLGILSNAGNDDVVLHVLSPEQERLFDAITLSHHVGLTKPDTGMYKAAAQKLQVAAKNCLFVDDQERHISGAEAVGMQTILYTNFAQFKTDFKQLASQSET